MLNPLSPHDALKHHFTSLKTDLISLQLKDLTKHIYESCIPINGNVSPSLNQLHPLQGDLGLKWMKVTMVNSGLKGLRLPAWKIRDRGFEPYYGLHDLNKQFFFYRLPVIIQYCGKPLRPGGSVLGLKPPGLKFRILCREGSVISFILPSSGGSPDPVYPIYAQGWQGFSCELIVIQNSFTYFVPLDLKGVSTTLQSGRYTFSYLRGQFKPTSQWKLTAAGRFDY